MHRQSIGSPSSRHHGITGDAATQPPAEELKVCKPIRSKSRTERSVHLIPVLTLLCLLILYLSSHDPSPADLASFSASSLLIQAKATSEMTGAVATMASQRGLKEDLKIRTRKLGDPISRLRT